MTIPPLQRVCETREFISDIVLLEDQLRRFGPGVVGVVGYFKGLVNRTLAVFIPSWFSWERLEFEIAVEEVQNKALRVLWPELASFSDLDREKIAGGLLSLGPWTSFLDEMVVLNTLLSFSLERLASFLGQFDIKLLSIPALTYEKLQRTVEIGYLTPEAAQRLIPALGIPVPESALESAQQ